MSKQHNVICTKICRQQLFWPISAAHSSIVRINTMKHIYMQQSNITGASDQAWVLSIYLHAIVVWLPASIGVTAPQTISLCQPFLSLASSFALSKSIPISFKTLSMFFIQVIFGAPLAFLRGRIHSSKANLIGQSSGSLKICPKNVRFRKCFLRVNMARVRLMSPIGQSEAPETIQYNQAACTLADFARI